MYRTTNVYFNICLVVLASLYEVNKHFSLQARKSKTIETNLNSINVNKFDLEFEVDPLFQKTSAAFDEGGTSGLLLNHLRLLDDTSELVLDSSTVVLNCDNLDSSLSSQTRQENVDLTDLRGKKHIYTIRFFLGGGVERQHWQDPSCLSFGKVVS